MQAKASREIIRIMRRNRIPGTALRNPRHEQFAQLIATGVKPRRAVELVGYSKHRSDSQASVLVRKAWVSQRIEELRRSVDQRAVTNAALTRTWVLQELKQNVSRAVQIEDLSAANRALELLGKELGMFVDRKVVGVQALIAELTPENLRNASADDLYTLLAVIDSELANEQQVEVGTVPNLGTDKADSGTVQ